MEINSTYYNHYNISYRYSPEKPKLPWWKEDYIQKTEAIHSNNSNPKDDIFKAATILEETYYSLGVANRAKYKTEDEVRSALSDKYLFSTSIYYNLYTKTEREVMYHNELDMTLFGCLSGGGDFRDPHIKGTVHGTRPEEKQAYNRTMVMKQINNIFKREGIKDLIGNKNLMFTIDPFSYKLGVSGTEDTTLINKIEEALNKDRNSIELFYHILKGTSKNIPTSVKDKFSLMNTFKNITGQDARDYVQREDGFYNSKGENILDVHRKYLEESNIPYKGVAATYFKELVQKNMINNFSETPDLYLSIGYKENKLYDVVMPNIQENHFDIRG